MNPKIKYLPSLASATFATALLLSGGCSQTLKLVEFKSGDSFSGTFDQSNHEVRIVLSDGEVLSGKYRATSNARFSLGTSLGRVGSHGIWGISPHVGFRTKKHAYALLDSASSNLLMEVIVDYNALWGGGYGEARTNDGREFKVLF